MLTEILSICVGACLGACCRWFASLFLNSLFLPLPPGTLAANWLGCFLMGLALNSSSLFGCADPRLRLGFITGFLGSLTTFSTFAAEMGKLLEIRRYLLFTAGILLHVGGSLFFFFLGQLLAGWMKESGA